MRRAGLHQTVERGMQLSVGRSRLPRHMWRPAAASGGQRRPRGDYRSRRTIERVLQLLILTSSRIELFKLISREQDILSVLAFFFISLFPSDFSFVSFFFLFLSYFLPFLVSFLFLGKHQDFSFGRVLEPLSHSRRAGSGYFCRFHFRQHPLSDSLSSPFLLGLLLPTLFASIVKYMYSRLRRHHCGNSRRLLRLPTRNSRKEREL